MYVNPAAQSLTRRECTVTLLSGLAEVPRSVHWERKVTPGSGWRDTGPTPYQRQGPPSWGDLTGLLGRSEAAQGNTSLSSASGGEVPGPRGCGDSTPDNSLARRRKLSLHLRAALGGAFAGRSLGPYHLTRRGDGGLSFGDTPRSAQGGTAVRLAAGESAGSPFLAFPGRRARGRGPSPPVPPSWKRRAQGAGPRGAAVYLLRSPQLELIFGCQRGGAVRAPRGPRAASTMLCRAACSTSRKLVPALGALGSRRKHSLPDLPYDYGALEPHINAQIMQLHHSKHHAAYVNNLNIAEEKYRDALEKGDVTAQVALQPAIKFNGGGHINHSIFWTNLSPNGGGEPEGELLEAIKRDFGSFKNFKEKLTTVSVGVQGSGWGWLGFNKEQGRLQIAACSNQDPLQGTTGLIPLLGIDVWEHAYYLQYKNVRPDYLKAIWNVISWENVTARYMAGKK
ncbi:superoxide dismutase [Mn], mitochondrial isoform 1-T1 [Megaptera novaeangliae]